MFYFSQETLFTEALSDNLLPAQGTSHYGGYWTPGDLLEAATVRPYPHKG